MPLIQRSAVVPHAAETMFDVVTDVDRYPEFLPGCRAARVLERDGDVQLATVSIAKRLPGLPKPEFTTRNVLERPARIDVELVDGPFRHLRGTWRFLAQDGGGCRAELEVDFEFASRLVGAVLAPGFGKLCDRMVDAFVRRADALGAGAPDAGREAGGELPL